jgi:hypothetical protein
MKKFTSLLIGCSLALAGAAMAQEPEAQPSPGKKHPGEKAHAAEAKPGANAAHAPETAPPSQRGPANAGKPQQMPPAAAAPANPAKPEQKTPKEHGAKNAAAPSKAPKPEAPKGEAQKPEQTAAPGANAAAPTARSAAPGGKQARQQHGKGVKAPAANAAASPAAAPANTPGASSTAAGAAAPSATPPSAATTSAAPVTAPSATAATAAAASATPPVAAAGTQSKAQTNPAVAAKKPDPQQVQQIKAQHATFRAQARPQQVPAVSYNPGYRIQGADQWQGPQYEVFRSYHPERHDQGWYRSRYQRVEEIGGGYYYWNNGYWYPAWGYNSSAEYYPYDGPIYVGHRAEPPDHVIADVQAELQQMGYYKGEVDGLLGPLTRQALTAYQSDNGLYSTAVIYEPTLNALGMG